MFAKIKAKLDDPHVRVTINSLLTLVLFFGPSSDVKYVAGAAMLLHECGFHLSTYILNRTAGVLPDIDK